MCGIRLEMERRRRYGLTNDQGPLMAHVTTRAVFDAGFNLQEKVVDVINNNTWTWPDCMLWKKHYGALKPFAIRDAWHSIRDRATEMDLYELEWSKYGIPRHSIHLWLVMRNQLKTQDRLRQWDVGDSVDLNLLRCPLCMLQPDSHGHLFECSFSKLVWVSVLDKAEIPIVSPKWADVMGWLKPLSKRNNVVNIVGRLIVVACSYFLWQEHNNGITKDKIVWIDVEGIPLRAWSKTNFNKIARKWGELVFMDDSNSANKYSLRICAKTTFFHLIAESLKVIINGKVYVVRAKEVIGLGGVKKKQWVKKLCHSNQVNFLSIQETKMVSLDVFMVKILWGNMLFDFAPSSARGRSGGILCVWDKLLFHKKRAYATEYCLCVEGLERKHGKRWWIRCYRAYLNGRQKLFLRFTLLKSVLGSMPTFHMSIFKVPSVIKAIHGDDGKLDKDVIIGGQTCWTSIVKEVRSLKGKGINVVDLIRLKLGNGDSSLFWEDKWYFWSLESEGDYSAASIRKLIDEK
nr:hypothetical protein [Tanacetum cinerariifolium]